MWQVTNSSWQIILALARYNKVSNKFSPNSFNPFQSSVTFLYPLKNVTFLYPQKHPKFFKVRLAIMNERVKYDQIFRKIRGVK